MRKKNLFGMWKTGLGARILLKPFLYPQIIGRRTITVRRRGGALQLKKRVHKILTTMIILTMIE